MLVLVCVCTCVHVHLRASSSLSLFVCLRPALLVLPRPAPPPPWFLRKLHCWQFQRLAGRPSAFHYFCRPSCRAEHCQGQRCDRRPLPPRSCCSPLCCEVSSCLPGSRSLRTELASWLLWVRTDDSIIFKSCDVLKAEKQFPLCCARRVWEFFERIQVMQIQLLLSVLIIMWGRQ